MARLDDSSAIIASVVIPVYNGSATIERCLDALAHQTVPAACFELIVVDDGSTDATQTTVSTWCQTHDGVHTRLIRQVNQGPAAARNRGAEVARGELLLFTDADCRPVESWIETFVTAFGLWPVDAPAIPASVKDITVKDITAAMGTYRCEQTDAAAQFAQLEFEERYARMVEPGTIDVVATYSAAFRRTVFRDAGGFDPSFPKANNEDVELSYRLSNLGHTMVFVPDAIVYHPHGEGWFTYAKTKMGRAYWRTIVYKRYPAKALKDSYTPQILKVQILLAPLCLLGLCWALLTQQWVGLVALLPFLLTTVPMMLFALQQGKPKAAFWVPWGLWLRSIVFAMGVALALFPRHQAQEWQRGIAEQSSHVK